jgi:cytochrome P450/NADPH-cytochrome P450 reductase
MWDDRDVPLRGLERLGEAHGPIYQVWLNGKRRIVYSSAELIEELINEKRFVKVPPPTLSERLDSKGLFTAPSTDDPN